MSSDPTPDPRVGRALDERYRRSLPLVLAGLCVMYLWQVISHPFLVPAGPGHILWNMAFGILVTFAGAAAWSWRRRLSRAQTSIVFAAAAVLATVNVVVHVVVTGQVRRTAGLILALMALGFLVFSTRLFLGLAVMVIAMWVGITRAAGLADEPGAWSFHLSILIQSFAVAAVAHLVRRRDLVEVETRRVALEDELARTEALLGALPDAVARVDRAGTLLALHAEGDWCGLSGDDLGRPLGESRLPAGACQAVTAALARCFEDGAVHTLEYVAQNDRRRHLDTQDSPREFEVRVRSASPDEAVMVFRNVTAERRAQRARDELVALVAHELRAPLTGILGSLNMLEDARELGPDQRRLIELGARSSERMARLVDDLLDLELAESGQLRLDRQRLDLADLARIAVETSQPASLGRAVRLRAEGAEPLFVDGDRDRLLQVLTNLLANATRYSPAGAEVRLRVERVEGGVRASVSDQGPGVPEELRSRLFQRFARGPGPQRGGAGLGLAISRTLVEAMAGHLAHEPGPGGGAVFHVTLPEARPARQVGSIAS